MSEWLLNTSIKDLYLPRRAEEGAVAPFKNSGKNSGKYHANIK